MKSRLTEKNVLISTSLGARSAGRRDNTIHVLVVLNIILFVLFVGIRFYSCLFILNHPDLLWSPFNAFDLLDFLAFKIHLDASNAGDDACETNE